VRKSLVLISANSQESRNELLTNPSLLPEGKITVIDSKIQTYYGRKIQSLTHKQV